MPDNDHIIIQFFEMSKAATLASFCDTAAASVTPCQYIFKYKQHFNEYHSAFYSTADNTFFSVKSEKNAGIQKVA